MTTQQTMFDSPTSHERSSYDHPETEFEFEDEMHPYHTSQMEYEEESDHFLGGLLGGLARSVLGGEEGEYDNPHTEFEYEDETNHYGPGMSQSTASEYD